MSNHYTQKYLAEFVESIHAYFSWYGVDIPTQVGVDQSTPYMFDCTPKTSSLKDIRLGPIQSNPTIEDVLASYGPWTIGYEVRPTVWKILTFMIDRMPIFNWFEFDHMTYDETSPGWRWAVEREVLQSFFGRGEAPKQIGAKSDPASMDRELFEPRATEYLNALIQKIAQRVEKHTGTVKSAWLETLGLTPKPAPEPQPDTAVDAVDES